VADDGSAVLLKPARREKQKQIPRTPSRTPENQGKNKTARDSARDDKGRGADARYECGLRIHLAGKSLRRVPHPSVSRVGIFEFTHCRETRASLSSKPPPLNAKGGGTRFSLA